MANVDDEEWEDVVEGESAENGAPEDGQTGATQTFADFDISDTETPKIEYIFRRIFQFRTNISFSLPEVPKTEPSEDGPSPKKLKKGEVATEDSSIEKK